jgi:MFS family permease
VKLNVNRAYEELKGIYMMIYIHVICCMFVGVSAGALTVVAPMYIAETAEPAVRGALSSLLLVMFNLGLLAVYVAGM